MAQPQSKLAVLTDLVSPLDILRKMHYVQNQNRSDAYRVPAESDVPEELREPSLSFDEVMEEWSLTPGQSASSLAAMILAFSLRSAIALTAAMTSKIADQ